VILIEQGASGGFGCLLKLKDTLKKGYFHILSHCFLIWLQSFNKLLIKPSNKIVTTKFEVNYEKNANFFS